MREKDRMREALEAWMASETKVAVAVFFRANPGIIDTLESLSERLAIPLDLLRPEIQDHVRLGVLRERRVGASTVYMLNRGRLGEIEGYVERLTASQEGR
jgi:hypothetical protein